MPGPLITMSDRAPMGSNSRGRPPPRFGGSSEHISRCEARASSGSPRRSRGSYRYEYYPDPPSRAPSSTFAFPQATAISPSPLGTRQTTRQSSSSPRQPRFEILGVQESAPTTSDPVARPETSVVSQSPVRAAGDSPLLPQPEDRRRVPTLSENGSISEAQRIEIVMAINVQDKGSLGCAYYESAENRVSLLHDLPFADLLHILDVLMVHIEPTVVLLPMKMPDEAVKFFEEHVHGFSDGKLLLSSYRELMF